MDIDKTFDRASGILRHENASSNNFAQEVTFEKCPFEPVMAPYGTLQMGRYSLSFERLANLQSGFWGMRRGRLIVTMCMHLWWHSAYCKLEIRIAFILTFVLHELFLIGLSIVS